MSALERTVSGESAGSDRAGDQPSSGTDPGPSDKVVDSAGNHADSDGGGSGGSSKCVGLVNGAGDQASVGGEAGPGGGEPVHELDMLAKMEEANRKLQITVPPPATAVKDASPTTTSTNQNATSGSTGSSVGTTQWFVELNDSLCYRKLQIPVPPAATVKDESPTSTSTNNNATNGSTRSCPSQLDLLAKLEEANRLLEHDKKSCKALTPTHSRAGSSVGVPTGSTSGHSRKGSSTSQVSTTSSNSHTTEEDAASPEKNLWEIWGKIVNDWSSAKKKPAFIKQLVRKGIPHPFRGLAWQLLLDVNTSPMKDQYVEYLKQKSPSEKMIRRDIARTFPEHDFFKEKDGLGQESLFHVMKAYSLVDREVGYCQGSGFIVGLLLMQMPEEEAFAVLVKLMKDYRLRELFKPSMAELGLCMFKLECLIQELLPDLYTHFQTQSFHTSMYASSWFLTLFATVVPLAVACRIMDLFISEGMDVIFRVGIAILQSSQPQLLSMDMEGMLQFFQRDISAKFERDEDTLFNIGMDVIFRVGIAILQSSQPQLLSMDMEGMLQFFQRDISAKFERDEDTLFNIVINCRRIDHHGMDVIFRVGIAILQSSQPQLLSMDMEAMLQFFQRDISAKFERDEDTLFNMACQVRISAKRFKRLEKEYTALKSKENEDQIELRRLRTENRLLRQRIDSLEKESATLADRLIQYQLTRAQEAEETYALKNELSLTKQRCSVTQVKLKEAESVLGDIKERTDSIHSASSLDEGEAAVAVQSLQEELIVVRLREAENQHVVKSLKQKIAELEQVNHRLQEAPSNDVQCLQEELIAVKLREAEANLSLKEMRQTVEQLEASWKLHIASDGEPVSPKGGGKKELKNELKKAQEDLMSSKLKEASALSHLKDSKQKVMELETSNQICTNQIRRMDEENKKLKGQIDDNVKQEAELQRQIKSLLRKMDDLESKRKEEGMMARIREAESDQVVGELKQKIAAIEIKNEEVLAADRLDSKGGNQELQNTIFDLQEEVMQLKMCASPKSPNTSAASSASPQASNKNEFDEEFEDDDELEDPESLNRTLSEIIEGKRSSNSLIAYLNRENSDCDSFSGSSESSSSNRLVTKSLLKDLELDRLKGEKSESVVRFEDIPLDKDSDQTNTEEKGRNSAIQTLNQSGTGTGDVTGSQLKNGSVLVAQSRTGSGSQSEAGNGALTGSESSSQTGAKVVTFHDAEKSAILDNQSKVVNGDVSKDMDNLMDSNDNISMGMTKHKAEEVTTQPDMSTA